jgi:hypothetical protein
MPRTDDQFTADELEMMNGTSSAASTNPEPDAEALADAAVASQETDTQASPSDSDSETTTTGDEAPADTQSASAAVQDQTEADKGFVPKFDATAPENYEEQKKALRAQKAELRSKWSSGELSDEEWAQAETQLDDQYENLRDQYLTAQALQKANEQIQRQQQQDTLKRLAADAKRSGIDYNDPGLAMLFDNRLSTVAASDEFKGKPFDAIAAEANRLVLQLFGKTGAQPEASPPNPKGQGAPSMQRQKLPQTLADLPAAAAQPVGSDLADQLDAIDDPDILEAKWASLPTSQRSAMLRSTLPARR